MKRGNVLYGGRDQEQLDESIEDVVKSLMDGGWSYTGGPESWEEFADQISWPIEVLVYRRKALPGPEAGAEAVLGYLLDLFDDEYGDPDGDNTDPTPGMKAAAETFVQAILSEYVPWQCEPTGEIIRVTREEAAAMLGEKEEIPA